MQPCFTETGRSSGYHHSMKTHRQPFTHLVNSLPASVPFVGPETLERQRGETFHARIGANESAFGISPQAQKAMQEALQADGCNWYGDPENLELRQALAEKHGVDVDEICVDAGIDSLLGLTVRMLIEPGMAVVTSNGAYPTFIYHVSGFDGQLHKVPYRQNHEDPEGLLAAAAKTDARLLYFSNPDNPMGTSHSASAVQQLINDLPPNCILALDEAYAEFARPGLTPEIDTTNPQVIRYRTFSKAYGMAGMRIGYVIANRELITGFNKIRNHFAVNRLAQIGALASVYDTGFLDTVLQQVEAGRQRIYSMADDLGLPYLPSSTNFVAVDLGDGERARTLLANLTDKGVFIRMPGVAPLDRYIRVGVGKYREHAYFESVFRQQLTAAHSTA